MKFRNPFRRRERDDDFLRIIPLPDPPDVQTLGVAALVLGEFTCGTCGVIGQRLMPCRHEKAVDAVSDWLDDVLQALTTH